MVYNLNLLSHSLLEHTFVMKVSDNVKCTKVDTVML